MSPKANNSTASGNSSTGKRFYTDIANKTNYIYVTPDITAPYRVYRFAITDITTPTVYNHISITNSYQMALDPSRDLGSVVAQNNQCVEIFDLLTMSFVTTFNYTRGKYPWFDSSVPGGWGIAIDSKRGLLYVAVDCDTPTPGIIGNTTSPTSPASHTSTIPFGAPLLASISALSRWPTAGPGSTKTTPAGSAGST